MVRRISRPTTLLIALAFAGLVLAGCQTAGTALTRELIASERVFIHALLRDGKITDETRRRIERDLDLEEASLSNREFRKIPL